MAGFGNRVLLYFLLLQGILTLTPPVLAQPASNLPCGAGAAPVRNLQWIEHIRDLGLIGGPQTESPEPVYYLPLSIHLLCRDDGNGAMELAVVLQTLCELNDKFRPAGLQFYLKGNLNYIRSTYYYNLPDYQTSYGLNDLHNVARSINVYFVNLGVMGLCGFANYPNTGMPNDPLRQGAVYMGIACSGPGNTTLAHELGHFLNLPHPFDGTSGQPAAIWAERVTRNPQEPPPRYSANCTTAGDRFCDTRADYRDNRWNCPDPSALLDINADPFNPDETLYMSYSLDVCANRFSGEQSQAMRATVSSPAASRGYLLTPPMAPFDSLAGTTQVVYPPDSSSGHPANWLHIRWRRVPGAQKYAVRVRRPTGTVAEWMVENGDTAFLYTGPTLRPLYSYRISVKPINHGWFCTDYSPDIVVTLSDSFVPCPVTGTPATISATVRADSSALLRATPALAGNSILWRAPGTPGGFVHQGSRYIAPPAARSRVYTVQEAADAYRFDLSPGPFLPDSQAHPGVFLALPPQGIDYFVRASRPLRWDWAALRSQGPAGGLMEIWQTASGSPVFVAQKSWQVGGAGLHQLPVALLLDSGAYRIRFSANPGSAAIWMSNGGTRFPYAMLTDCIIDSTGQPAVGGGWEFGGIFDWQMMAFCTGAAASVSQIVLPNRLILDDPPVSCVGDIVFVPLRLDLEGSLSGFQFELEFDSTRLEFLGVQTANPAWAGMNLQVLSPGSGRRRVVGQLPQPLLWGGLSEFIRLSVRRLQGGYANIDWVPTACVVTTPSGVATSILYRNAVSRDSLCAFLTGQIAYARAAPTPLPGWTIRGVPVSGAQWTTVSGTSGSFQLTLPPANTYALQLTSPLLWGGVNATDALWVLRYFGNLQPLDSLAVLTADVNATGSVNATDALHIAQRYSSLRNGFARPDWVWTPIHLTVVTGVPVTPLSLLVRATGDVNGSLSVPGP
jgi:hypothetical protein